MDGFGEQLTFPRARIIMIYIISSPATPHPVPVSVLWPWWHCCCCSSAAAAVRLAVWLRSFVAFDLEGWGVFIAASHSGTWSRRGPLDPNLFFRTTWRTRALSQIYFCTSCYIHVPSVQKSRNIINMHYSSSEVTAKHVFRPWHKTKILSECHSAPIICGIYPLAELEEHKLPDNRNAVSGGRNLAIYLSPSSGSGK